VKERKMLFLGKSNPSR